jgi:hypothetical protein
MDAGLPDDLFSSQKSKFGHILEGLGMKNFAVVHVIWNILCLFGIIYASLV